MLQNYTLVFICNHIFGEMSITRVHKNISTRKRQLALHCGLGLAQYSRYMEYITPEKQKGEQGLERRAGLA